MRKRDKDTQGLADLEYLVEGGIRGAPTELTPGPKMYVPVVDEIQSAMDAKESGASALAELKEGNLGTAGLDSLMAVLSALGAVPVVGRVPATVGKAIEKVFPKKIDSIGSTSLSIDTYSGITVPMTKDKFFDNVEDLKTPKKDSVSFLKEKMEDGEEIGRPFIVLEWTGTDWKPKKSFHEGRHRMIAAEEVFGKDAKVPVNVQLRNKAGNKIPIKELTGERDFYTVKDSTEADLMLTKFEEWKKSSNNKSKIIKKQKDRDYPDTNLGSRLSYEKQIQFLEDHGFSLLTDNKNKNFTYDIVDDKIITYSPVGGKGHETKVSRKTFKNPTLKQMRKWMGYKKGGAIVERNPYNYTAKAI